MKTGASGHADHRKKVRGPLHAGIEKALYQWFLNSRALNEPTVGSILAAEAKKFVFLPGKENCTPDGGCIQCFKDRHVIV